MSTTTSNVRPLTVTYEGCPCRNCGTTTKYRSNRMCVVCTARRNRTEPLRAAKLEWTENNPDRYAALAGKHNASRRYPGCVAPDFDLEATVPFYQLARELTRTTGLRFECDHIIPLCEGAIHDWTNLQVLRVDEHQRKTATEHPRSRKESAA